MELPGFLTIYPQTSFRLAKTEIAPYLFGNTLCYYPVFRPQLLFAMGS
jgi:hypothetical protein